MTTPDLESYVASARAWLDENAERRPPASSLAWGEGSDNVALFHNLSFEAETALIDAQRRWQQLKSDAGYGSISYPSEYGGAGLPGAYDDAFRRLEREYVTPKAHEAVGISMNIEAPTILALGNDAQKKRYVESLRRTDEMCCQLFSEPGAGSDLGSISMRAVLDGEEWVVNGQKVWTSGARHADFGYLIARTEPDAPRQRAMTAFVVDMKTPGVEVRPLKQMTGGSSFNEVFFTDVRLPDETARLGDVGAGWGAAMTTLGFERASAVGGGGGVDPFDILVLVARHLGRDKDPRVRQGLAELYIDNKVRGWTTRRAFEGLKQGGVPGPEGSIGKLATTNGYQKMTAVASLVLGPRMVAETGEWGTFAWAEFACGVPGFRLGGGTDEIQRNTIAERALGLPREPRPA